MTPLECLQKQLDVWIGALHHAQKSFQIGVTSQEQYDSYKKNLTVKITQFEQAIGVLKMNNIS